MSRHIMTCHLPAVAILRHWMIWYKLHDRNMYLRVKTNYNRWALRLDVNFTETINELSPLASHSIT